MNKEKNNMVLLSADIISSADEKIKYSKELLKGVTELLAKENNTDPKVNEKDTEYDNIISCNIVAANFSTHVKPSSYKEGESKKRGRPKKEALKNKNFSITMNPILYERIRIIAQKYTRGNISALIETAINEYCKLNKINLDEIQVKPEVLEEYKKTQKNRKM